MNDNCNKMMHMGMIDRGFTVLFSLLISEFSSLHKEEQFEGQ
jgi:hypothetical protein